MGWIATGSDHRRLHPRTTSVIRVGTIAVVDNTTTLVIVLGMAACFALPGYPATQSATSPAPDLISAATTLTEDSHYDWYSKRAHFKGILE